MIGAFVLKVLKKVFYEKDISRRRHVTLYKTLQLNNFSSLHSAISHPQGSVSSVVKNVEQGEDWISSWYINNSKAGANILQNNGNNKS